MPDEEVKTEALPQDDAGKILDAAMSRFEGAFIESADLMQSQATLTISGVVPPNTEKDSAKKLINRPIVAFRGTTKRFIVGKTNERLLKALHGKKASGWLGKQVKIGVRYLPEAFGQTWVPTLRIIMPPDVPMPMSCRKHYGFAEPRIPE